MYEKQCLQALYLPSTTTEQGSCEKQKKPSSNKEVHKSTALLLCEVDVASVECHALLMFDLTSLLLL